MFKCIYSIEFFATVIIKQNNVSIEGVYFSILNLDRISFDADFWTNEKQYNGITNYKYLLSIFQVNFTFVTKNNLAVGVIVSKGTGVKTVRAENY